MIILSSNKNHSKMETFFPKKVSVIIFFFCKYHNFVYALLRTLRSRRAYITLLLFYQLLNCVRAGCCCCSKMLPLIPVLIPLGPRQDRLVGPGRLDEPIISFPPPWVQKTAVSVATSLLPRRPPGVTHLIYMYFDHRGN